MNFITGLPRSRRRFDSLWVIVDRLTKSAHFLPVMTTFSVEYYAKLHTKEIVQLNGVSISIISDRGTQFRANSVDPFKKDLVLGSTLVELFIHKQTVRTNALSRCLRTCYEHVF